MLRKLVFLVIIGYLREDLTSNTSNSFSDIRNIQKKKKLPTHWKKKLITFYYFNLNIIFWWPACSPFHVHDELHDDILFKDLIIVSSIQSDEPMTIRSSLFHYGHFSILYIFSLLLTTAFECKVWEKIPYTLISYAPKYSIAIHF